MIKKKFTPIVVLLLFISHPGRAQWSKVYEFSHQEPVFKLHESYGQLFTQNSYLLNKESTVGTPWEPIFKHDNLYVDDVVFFDPFNILIKSYNTTNHHIGICRSSDGGKSWQIDSLTYNNPKYTVIGGLIAFGKDTIVLGMSTSRFLMSVDGGVSFDTVFTLYDTRVGSIFNSFKINSNSAFFYSSSYSEYRTFITEDRGLTWRLLYTFDDHVVNFQRIADSLIYAVGRNGKFYISRDEGRSWTVNQIAKGRHMVNLHFIDKDTGYVCGGEPGLPPLYGFIYRTFDGGQTWTDVSPVDCRFQINALYFYDGYTGMAFSNYGETYRTTTGGGVGKAVTDLVSGDMAIGEATSNGVSVFPNPTSTTVEITWDFVSPSSSVLKLINIQGMELHSTSMDNRHRLTLNVRDLPVGVYLLQMDSPRGKVLKKFIISR
jgi:hypothetical protein